MTPSWQSVLCAFCTGIFWERGDVILAITAGAFVFLLYLKEPSSSATALRRRTPGCGSSDTGSTP